MDAIGIPSISTDRAPARLSASYMSEIIAWAGASVPALPPAMPSRRISSCMKLPAMAQAAMNADATASASEVIHLREKRPARNANGMVASAFTRAKAVPPSSPISKSLTLNSALICSATSAISTRSMKPKA
jgi:hypothetical protein